MQLRYAVSTGILFLLLAGCSGTAPTGEPDRDSGEDTIEVEADGPLLTYKPSSTDSLGAELIGTLALEDGCLRVISSDAGAQSWTVVFPSATWNSSNRTVDVAGLKLTVGESVVLGGGYMEPGHLNAEYPDHECLTEDYFFAGTVDRHA